MLGELLIDVIGIVAAMGFAAEVAHCLYLCGETWRKGDKGATNEMIARSMERKGWAALLREARAAKRQRGGDTQLIRAVEANNLPRVEQLVQLGAPLELRDDGSRTALHWACYRGHEFIAKALLDGKYEGRGAEVDALDNGGWTPLISASCVGREGVVRLLLARGREAADRDLRARARARAAKPASKWVHTDSCIRARARVATQTRPRPWRRPRAAAAATHLRCARFPSARRRCRACARLRARVQAAATWPHSARRRNGPQGRGLPQRRHTLRTYSWPCRC